MNNLKEKNSLTLILDYGISASFSHYKEDHYKEKKDLTENLIVT